MKTFIIYLLSGLLLFSCNHKTMNKKEDTSTNDSMTIKETLNNSSFAIFGT